MTHDRFGICHLSASIEEMIGKDSSLHINVGLSKYRAVILCAHQMFFRLLRRFGCKWASHRGHHGHCMCEHCCMQHVVLETSLVTEGLLDWRCLEVNANYLEVKTARRSL